MNVNSVKKKREKERSNPLLIQMEKKNGRSEN
jgi:hypothetical protein